MGLKTLNAVPPDEHGFDPGDLAGGEHGALFSRNPFGFSTIFRMGQEQSSVDLGSFFLIFLSSRSAQLLFYLLMARMIDEEGMAKDFRDRLRKVVKDQGGMAAFSRRTGISSSHQEVFGAC